MKLSLALVAAFAASANAFAPASVEVSSPVVIFPLILDFMNTSHLTDFVDFLPFSVLPPH